MFSFFCYFTAFLSTFIWINVTIADIMTTVSNPYQKTEEDIKLMKTRSIVKTILVLIMAIFWSSIICF